jgi:hypothetical protein
LNGTTSIRPLQQEVQLAPFHGSLARFDDACSKTETADMMRMGSAAKISSSTSPKRIATAAEASITMARLLARQSDPVAPRPFSALGVSRSGCAADRLSDRQELVTSPRRGARAFLVHRRIRLIHAVAGLHPAIHATAHDLPGAVDARIKSGHDRSVNLPSGSVH